MTSHDSYPPSSSSPPPPGAATASSSPPLPSPPPIPPRPSSSSQQSTRPSSQLKSPYQLTSDSNDQEEETLYSRSPHVPIDKREARRKLKQQHRQGRHTDPNLITLVVLLLAVAYWLAPIPGIFELIYRPRSNSFHHGDHSTACSEDPSSDCLSRHGSNLNLNTKTMPWQKTITLSSRTKGCHLVTEEVVPQIQDGLKDVKVGLLTLFIQHTSAALSLNENFDRDVRTDMDMALDKVIPESLPWRHTDEGPDDSASHTKASLIGPSITIPITNGRLNTGTWQGIYLCEFRRLAHKRKIVATILP